jgi:protoporphyrinogen oxidase
MTPHTFVIGAGPMGLAAALDLAEAGHAVELFERDDRIGGMSAAVDFDGLRIERYYHFICRPDQPLFDLLARLGLHHRLRWRPTRMGFYFNGQLHDWGHPLALLRFPGLNLIDKLRYALHVIRAKGIRDWRPYDAISSTQWLKRWVGERAYEVLWRSLFHYKFYEWQDDLSAAWLGTRIQRVARSRRSVFQEELGYLEGGSEVLLDAMAERLRRLGGKIHLNAPVDEIAIEGGRILGLRVAGQLRRADGVVSTIPLPYLARLAPGLPATERDRIAAIRNVGVVCVMLKLKRPFTGNFWTNIHSPGIEIPGLIEYTNLNPMDGCATPTGVGDPAPALLYAPYYMPQSHPKFGRDAQAFIDETLGYLRQIRPDFDPDDVMGAVASRYEFAQTVCSPGFFSALPPMRSAVVGLFLADTSHYYPEDRSISESVRIGFLLARMATDRKPAGTEQPAP